MTDYEICVAIGDACYRQGFVETGRYDEAWRSGCAVGAKVAQEVAKLVNPTKEDVDRIAAACVATSFKQGSVR